MPTLALVKPPADARWKAPPHLAPATQQWFLQVVGEYELEEHHVRLLTAACEAWDQMTAARAAIAREGMGMTYTDRWGQPKARPEVAIARDATVTFARLLRELALDVSTPDDSRPPGLGGRRR
jgi:phage terminase small subunit